MLLYRTTLAYEQSKYFSSTKHETDDEVPRESIQTKQHRFFGRGGGGKRVTAESF